MKVVELHQTLCAILQVLLIIIKALDNHVINKHKQLTAVSGSCPRVPNPHGLYRINPQLLGTP